ncbi:hypothetical protein TUM20983_36840 [Mycobacterium antarcticum]|nr:hypothetical protein TUM20983_36840 [Mycolicibacterium sp. TUM20983]
MSFYGDDMNGDHPPDPITDQIRHLLAGTLWQIHPDQPPICDHLARTDGCRSGWRASTRFNGRGDAGPVTVVGRVAKRAR